MADENTDRSNEGGPDVGRAQALSLRARRVIDLLASHPDGLEDGDLLAAARVVTPTISTAALTAAIREAGAHLTRIDGRWTVTAGIETGPDDGEEPTTDPAEPTAAPLTRIVIVDVEAEVRPSAEHPYSERHLWQIGAVRAGTDPEWIAARPTLTLYVDVPGGVNIPARSRTAHADSSMPRATAAAALADYCADTDLIGTWHGQSVDIPELATLFAESGVTAPAATNIDVAYLAYCCWPLAPSHQLTLLAETAGIDTTGLTAHDALDDATVTAAVLTAAAAHLRSWDPALTAIVAAAGQSSPIWDAVFDIAGIPFIAAGLDEHDTAADLADLLAARSPVRTAAPAAAPVFRVANEWRGPDGHVDAHLLAQAGHPGAIRRTPQTEMTNEIAAAIGAHADLAIEAATGTGKSLAALAAAFDWIDGHIDRVAIIATHTKQLQRQLAQDVLVLAGTNPALTGTATIVKGASNRLSTRALIAHLVDASHSRIRNRRAEHDELVLFLLLRFLKNPDGLVEEWEVRSVDAADLPAFFDDYTSRRAGMWAANLSQYAAGDFASDNADLGPHTRLVREHINSGRLLIANHALVLAHADDLPAGCLLIADEAHTLEDAATGSFAATFDLSALEIAAARLRRLMTLATLDGAARDATERLQAVLATNVLHRTAQFAIDGLAGPRQGGRMRTAAIASPYTGVAQAGPAIRLGGELRRVVTATDAARRTLFGWLASNRASIGPSVAQIADDVVERLNAISDHGSRIVDDLIELGLLPPSPATPGAAATPTSGTAAAAPAAAMSAPATVTPSGAGSAPVTLFDDLDADNGDDAADPDENDYDAGDDTVEADPADTGSDPSATAAAGTVPAVGLIPPGNRVIWFAEQPEHDHTPGGYRFTITSSPIRVGEETGWQTLWQQVAAVVLTSATLTVAGTFDHLFDRLGLNAGRTPRQVRTHTIVGSFDYRNQARLVCFDDFPSWAEHSAAAQRLIAHQLAGWAIETETYGQRTPGAMVLTTSTAAAGAISEHLATELGRVGATSPLQPAVVWGNRRAVDSFNTDGGILVGTKGLWAGVDVAEPGRCQIVWVNKLPFAPFADPVIAARRADVEARATAAGIADPQAHATEHYYLPLAAIELRQAVGRLLRSDNHYGVIVISDRKLAGTTRQRRLYRQLLLGSLDPGLLNSAGSDIGAGNVTSMAAGWETIWLFLAARTDIDPARVTELCSADALRAHTMLPAARAIAEAELTETDEHALRVAGTLETVVLERCERVAGALRFSERPIALKDKQREAIAATVAGNDLCALLPTGFGKSWCFQLPALILPGLTIVVSPLVALMTDQVLDLNPVLGDRVRALVSMMSESMSRAGRAELAAELTGAEQRGIKLVYVSPERFAQATFRTWVGMAVASGRVRRIVFDEAHTAVTWGDDFRPSYRRLTGYLDQLRQLARNSGRRLAISAYTATANRSVREGLRTRLFNLTAQPPASGDRTDFTMVSAEPIRPELAIYRRRLAGGHITRAALLESLVSAIEEHSIIYCTTVRDVEATWSHLIDYLGPARAAGVRRFHGRLPDAEKQSVLTDFKDAPTRDGTDGPFQPMIVVATSAFGLGVNRNDIRNVICLTPPTDLAALYQQLGRAGRDRHGNVPGPGEPASVGVAIATARGFRTVEFLTQDIPRPLLHAAANRVLAAARTGTVDPTAAAAALIAADLAAGRIDAFEARRKSMQDRYRTIVMRALSTLVAAGTLDDRGDHPADIRIGPSDASAVDGFSTAVVAYAADGPKVVAIDEMRAHLNWAGYPSQDTSELWSALVGLFNAGVIDVAVASQTWRTSVTFPTGPVTTIPAQFDVMADVRTVRARIELDEMRAWFAENTRCANEGLADYFATTLPSRMPATVCSTPGCRCLSCWGRDGHGEAPHLYEALIHPHSRPAGSATSREQALDRSIATLLYDQPRGLGPRMIWRVLRGEEMRWDMARRQRVSLPRKLLYHRLFNSKPGLRDDAVVASLGRLVAVDAVALCGYVWRHRHWIDLEGKRAAATTPAASVTVAP